MPLPNNGMKWPPAQLAPITRKQAEYDAWYSGDPEKLSKVYRLAPPCSTAPVSTAAV